MAADFRLKPKHLYVYDAWNLDSMIRHMHEAGIYDLRDYLHRDSDAPSVEVPHRLLAERVVLSLLDLQLPEVGVLLKAHASVEAGAALRAGLFQAYYDDIPMSRS